MSDDIETPRPRTSRFKEHTNTNNSIKPPPDELWKDLGIEKLIDDFNEENSAPPVIRRNASGTSTNSASSSAMRHAIVKTAVEVKAPGKHHISAVSVSAAPRTSTSAASSHPSVASEGTFGRFRSAFASVFGNVLGKRKAGNADAEKDKEKQVLDDRKRAADAAYQEAMEKGLLPTPKVFVRPGMAGRTHQCAADAVTPARTPRTPSLYHTPSKKDLNKQKKLMRRVSDLEHKLASARKELQSVLHTDAPPVPALPSVLPPTPTTSHSENELSPTTAQDTPLAAQSQDKEAPQVGKITKKRKALPEDHDDADYKPIATDTDRDDTTDADVMSVSSAVVSDADRESSRGIKRVKSTKSHRNLKKHGQNQRGRSPNRLQKRHSKQSITRTDEVVITVIPDGISVPAVPELPLGLGGKKDVPEKGKGKGKGKKPGGSKKGDDGYGGLEHEMF